MFGSGGGWGRRLTARAMSGFHARLVRAAYRGLLGRDPEPSGFASSMGVLSDGLPWGDYLRGFVKSHEFALKYSHDVEDLMGSVVGSWWLLEELDADITVPLDAFEESVGPLRLRGPARDTSVFKLLVHNRGLWEPGVTAFLLDVLRPGDTFVDVGANIGYFTVIGGARVGREGRVVAFEPWPMLRDYCRANVRLNGLANVTLSEHALWDSRTTKEMVLPGDFMGGAIIVPEDRPTDDPGKIEVACAPLDELVASGRIDLAECHVIKMDIEGAEPFALDGMAGLLQRTRPVLLIELNTHCLSFHGLDPESVWDALDSLAYRVLALEKENQAWIFERLSVPLVRPDLGLRQFRGFADFKDAVKTADEHAPAPPCDPLDLVALPAEAPVPR